MVLGRNARILRGGLNRLEPGVLRLLVRMSIYYVGMPSLVVRVGGLMVMMLEHV